MLDNKSKVIDVVSYLIIFLLLLLVILPPLLRWLMPEGDSYDNTVHLENLRCVISEESGYNKIVNTQYKNKELTRVYITYENYTDETLIEEKELVGISGISEDIENNKIVYTIEYNEETKNNELLRKYFTDIESLKSTYESNNYTCDIITN